MKTKDSKALIEVWEMKQAVYEETKHLKGHDYFDYIHEQTKDINVPRVQLKGKAPKKLSKMLPIS